MHVGVNEAGEHGPPSQVVDFGPFSYDLGDLIVGADPQDTAALSSQRFGY